MLGFQFPDNPHCPSHVRGELSSSCDRGRLEHLSRAPLFNRTSHRFTAQPPSLVKAMTRTVIRKPLRNNSIPTPFPSPPPPFFAFRMFGAQRKDHALERSYDVLRVFERDAHLAGRYAPSPAACITALQQHFATAFQLEVPISQSVGSVILQPSQHPDASLKAKAHHLVARPQFPSAKCTEKQKDGIPKPSEWAVAPPIRHLQKICSHKEIFRRSDDARLQFFPISKCFNPLRLAIQSFHNQFNLY
jgi:hypothetical protein